MFLRFCYVSLVTLFCTFFQTAHAELFYFPAVSTTAVSMAYANAGTGLDDVSMQFYNPATICFVEHNQWAISCSDFYPNMTFGNGAAATILDVEVEGPTKICNSQRNLVGGGIYGAIAGGKRLRFGLAITTPVNFNVAYPEDWVGRYYGTNLEMYSCNITPSIGYSIADFLCFAAGVQFQYTHMFMKQAIDFGSIADFLNIPDAVPTMQDGFQLFKADDWQVGWVAGITAKLCPNFLIGAGWRSRIRHGFMAIPDFRLGRIGLEVREILDAYGGNCANAQVELFIPRTIYVGFDYHYNPQWEFYGTLTYKAWNENQAFRFNYNDNNQPINMFTLNWRDNFAYAFGFKYRPTCRIWSLKAGAQYEQNPVPSERQNPFFFAEENVKLAAGFHWQIKDCAYVELGYVYTIVKDIKIDQSVFLDENVPRSSLLGNIHTKQNTFSAQLGVDY